MTLHVEAVGYRALGVQPCCATSVTVPDGTNWDEWLKSKDVRDIVRVHLKEFGAPYTKFTHKAMTLFVAEAV